MVDTTKKAEYILDMQKKFERAKVMVLVNYSGVNVEQMTRIRKEIRASGDEMRVVRNTLVKRLCKQLGHEALLPHLEGPTAIAFGYNDPVAPVKALVKFAGEVAKFEFKTGMLEGKLLGTAELEALSKLPGREQLLSMLLSVLQAPIRNLAVVLSQNIAKLAYALEAVKKKKSETAPAA